jgi:hypothetical protein
MKTFFEVVLGLVVLWAIFYYPYWHLIRPAILLRLRYRIFDARDRLRMLVVSKSIGEKSPAYPIIENRCHACLSIMEEVDFLELFAAKPSPEQKLRAKHDFEIIERSGHEIRAIHMDVLHSVVGGVLLNSPGLLIPAAVVLLLQFWFAKVRRFMTITEMSVWGATYARA